MAEAATTPWLLRVAPGAALAREAADVYARALEGGPRAWHQAVAEEGRRTAAYLRAGADEGAVRERATRAREALWELLAWLDDEDKHESMRQELWTRIALPALKHADDMLEHAALSPSGGTGARVEVAEDNQDGERKAEDPQDAAPGEEGDADAFRAWARTVARPTGDQPRWWTEDFHAWPPGQRLDLLLTIVLSDDREADALPTDELVAQVAVCPATLLAFTTCRSLVDEMFQQRATAVWFVPPHLSGASPDPAGPAPAAAAL